METSDNLTTARATILREGVRQAFLSGADSIKIDLVLRQAHASSSSLYHHFGNRAGLVAAVRAEVQRLGLEEEDPTILDALDEITTPADFANFMAAQLFRLVADPATIRRREFRLEALARPESDQPSHDLIEALIDRTTEFVQVAIDRGLCNPNLDARAYAVLFMSLSLGQIATRNMITTERWLITATEAALAPLHC